MILGLVGLYATGVVVTAGIEVAWLACIGFHSEKERSILQHCRKIDIAEVICETSVKWPKLLYDFAKKRNGSKNEEKNENDAV